jgi:hypothetical protein
LTEVDVTVAAGTTENWRCVEVRARDITEDGTTNSYYLLQVYDHFFGNCAV